MSWQSVFKEGRAVARQLRLLLDDRGETFEDGAKPIVFFLHGLYATAGEFRPLRNDCKESLGLATAAYSHRPGVGIDSLTQNAADWVARVSEGKDYFLIGHSLGALAWARAHQRNLLPVGCRGTLALAAPLMGANLPQLAPLQAGRDLTPGSPILRELREQFWQLPMYWVEAKDDRLAQPWMHQLMSEQPILRHKQSHCEQWEALGHNGILFDERTKQLLTRLLKAQNRRE